MSQEIGEQHHSHTDLQRQYSACQSKQPQVFLIAADASFALSHGLVESLSKHLQVSIPQ